MDIDSVGGSYTFRAANPVQYIFNVPNDASEFAFWLGRNTIPSTGYWGKVYIYEVLLNGVKIL